MCYRGSRFAAISLSGIYFYGDFCNGNIWAAQRKPEGGWQTQLVLASDLPIASFGEDAAGELFVISLSGEIYRIIPCGKRIICPHPVAVGDIPLPASVEGKSIRETRSSHLK